MYSGPATTHMVSSHLTDEPDELCTGVVPGARASRLDLSMGAVTPAQQKCRVLKTLWHNSTHAYRGLARPPLHQQQGGDGVLHAESAAGACAGAAAGPQRQFARRNLGAQPSSARL